MIKIKSNCINNVPVNIVKFYIYIYIIILIGIGRHEKKIFFNKTIFFKQEKKFRLFGTG